MPTSETAGAADPVGTAQRTSPGRSTGTARPAGDTTQDTAGTIPRNITRNLTGRPGRWRRLLPVPVEPARLPEVWRLVHEPETDDYAVLGCRGDDPPTVVIRIAYAAGDDGSDLRLPLASLVTVGIAQVVRQRIHQI